jgi:predicted TIM-barrel fold metal-dependent hydrolase
MHKSYYFLTLGLDWILGVRPGHDGVTRRQFVGILAAGAATGALGSLTACAGQSVSDKQSSKAETAATASASSTASSSARYDVVDSHLHYLDFLQKTDGFSALASAMDSVGVSQSVIFGMAMAKQWDEDAEEAPTYYLSNDSRCYYYSGTDFLMLEDLQKQPEAIRKRFFPFVCGINPNDRLALEHIKQLVDMYPNTICGIGELMSRHDDLTALTYGEPPHLDHPAFLDIFDYAAEQGLPVLVHHNITGSNTEKILYRGELETALAHNRNAKIIWAHIGISRRVEVPGLSTIADELLKAHPNLWIDISWIVYDYYFLDEFPDRYADGVSMDDWVALMEKWPDRFMVGTDKVGHWRTYPDEVTKYYSLLDRLKPETAKKICHDNILSLVKTY